MAAAGVQMREIQWVVFGQERLPWGRGVELILLADGVGIDQRE